MPAVSGILNLSKPPGATSMEMVRLAKRLTRQQHVGHGGTLDPEASGVLPIFFGQATRTMEFLINSTKIYRAEITLGITTDTYDHQGQVIAEQDSSGITLDQVRQALEEFRGIIHQVPPKFSALKHEGQRFYDLARAGKEVPRQARRVQVFRLDIVTWNPPQLGLEIECGRGVYIRSLAYDLGQALECGAYLSALTRLCTGPFVLDDALSEEQATQAFQDGSWPSLLYPPDIVLLHLPAAVVSQATEAQVRTGRAIALPTARHAPVQREGCRLYTVDGRFLALLRFHQARNVWQPDKVFAGT